MTTPPFSWDDPSRHRLAELADVLLPGGSGMPSASEAEVHTLGIDRVFAARPDLLGSLHAVVRSSLGEAPADVVTRLHADDPVGWDVLTTCVAAAYYMTPSVRRLLGYAGQEGVLTTADDFYGWASAGLLDPVLDRGPIHRPTPD